MEIKASDLRPGNLLRGEPFSIHRLNIYSDGTTAITAHGISQIEDGVDLGLKPIEITDLWLVNNNFILSTCVDDMIFTYKLNKEFRIIKKFLMHDFIGYYVTIDTNHFKEIKYIHKLQNYYYERYDEEIIFSSEF